MPCAVRTLDFYVVFKRELLWLPGMGSSMWLAGYLSVDRRNKDSGKQLLLDASAALRRGIGSLWFPEGTRFADSAGGPLGPFKPGAFLVAKEGGAHVLPVTISGARRIMPAESFCMGFGRVVVTVHPAIASADKSVQELSDAARVAIESALTEVDALPPATRTARAAPRKDASE